jgi:Flp pilus assembly protein TadD
VKVTPPPEPKKEPVKPVEAAPKDQEKDKTEAASSPSPDVRKLLNEARAALALKDFNAAGTKYDAVLALEPTNTVALASLGVIRYQQNRLDDAEEYLRKAAAAAPNDSNTRSLLGVVYFRKGAIEDAYAELNRAVAIDPHNAEAHNYLGIVLSEKGWSASGELEIRRAIEINPQYADAHFNLAVVYSKQRTPKLELARYHYKKALDLGAKPDPGLEALLKKLSEKPAAPADGEEPKP